MAAPHICATTLSGERVSGNDLAQLRRRGALALNHARAAGRDMIGGVGYYSPEHVIVLSAMAKVVEDDALWRLTAEERQLLTVCGATGRPRYHKFSPQAVVNYLQLRPRDFAEELRLLGVRQVEDVRGDNLVGRLERSGVLPLVNAFWQEGGAGLVAAFEDAQHARFLFLQHALMYGLHKFGQEHRDEGGWQLHAARPVLQRAARVRCGATRWVGHSRARTVFKSLSTS